ncbi:MAG: hypothetical protein ABIY51_03840, partial [Ferruginibacter sp.]
QGTNLVTVTAGSGPTMTLTLTETNANGCSTTNTLVVTVNPVPVCAITGNNVICVGFSTSFTATGGTSYSWTGPGGFTAATATISNLTVAGTYSVTVTNANGCTSSCSRDLTINSLPVCNITGNNIISVGQTATFTASGGTSYTWTGPGGFTANTAVISNLTVAGTYTVTVTNANGCTSSCSRLLIVESGGPIPCLITGPAITCASTTGLIYSVPATYATYSWTVTGGTITAGQGTNQITVTAGASGNITVTANVSNPLGSSGSCTKITPISALPICTITGPSTACQGTTGLVFTSAAGNATYVWSATGGTITAGAGTNQVTVTAGLGANLVLTLTTTNAAGCTSTCTYNVTLYANPVCAIAGPTSVCAGATGLVYQALPGWSSYVWTITGGTITSGQGTYLITVTAGSGPTMTLTVVITNANGCTTTLTYLVTINAGTVCNITGNQTICFGQSSSFTATGGTNYSWTGPGGFTATTATISNLTVAGTYTVTVSNAGGCTSSCNRTLTVNALPVCDIIGNQSICVGQSTGFTATGGTSYTWTGPGGFTAATATISNLTVAGTYTVTVTNANGCTSSCSRTLTVNALPICNITGNNIISAGQTATFTATGGASYTWTGPGGYTANTAVISNLTVAGTYTVTVTNASGCTSTCTRLLIVEQGGPLPCLIAGPQTTCAGATGLIYSVPATYATYSWIVTGGTITAGQGTSQITVTAGTTGNVVVTANLSNPLGSSGSCTKMTAINPLPVCAISGNQAICSGQSTSFTATGGTSYSWTGPGGYTANTATINNLTVAGTYVVIVTNANGCTSSCSRVLSITPVAPCTLTAPVILPICGSTDNTLSVTGTYSNYAWSVTGNGTYLSGNGTNTIHYNVGASGMVTISLTATNANGCTTSCSVSFSCGQGRACSQGFYKTHPQVWDEFTDILVAGGTSGGYTYAGMPAGYKFITTTNFYTYYNLPAGSISGIPAGANMHTAGSTGGGGCFNLARQGNAALLNTAAWGNSYLAGTGFTSFVNLYNAIRAAFLSGNCGTLADQLDTYNNRYDHEVCSSIPGAPRGRLDVLADLNKVTVSAFPNPYTDKVVFTVESKVAGDATLELFGLLGEKVKTLFDGHIEKDGTRKLIYEAPSHLRKSLVYKFRVGGEVITGKVLYIN